MTTEYFIRRASVADAGEIARQRALMFQDMGQISAADAKILLERSEPRLLGDGGYASWFVERAGAPVAGGGVLVRDVGPVPDCLRHGRLAIVANIYTDPAHRGRGLARKIMRTILAWCEENAIDHVTLAASDVGRPLYVSLGFEPTNDMRLPKRQSALR